jgi:predicted DNA-binding transcriptional regulator YafY
VSSGNAGSGSAERLVSLVTLLANAELPQTRDQIRRRVQGYAQLRDEATFRREFERDKQALRDLGVRLETVGEDSALRDAGYRLDLDAGTMPAIAFTADEVRALGVAAALWRGGGLSRPAERALVKFRALGYRTTAAEPDGVEAGFAAPGTAFEPLVRAVAARCAVRFRYRTAHGGTGERTVEPWRLRAAGRAWYVAGFDRSRGAARLFRLSRIEGRVRLVREAGPCAVPDREAVEAVFAPLGGAGEPRVAELAVVPGQAHLLRARALGAGDDAGTPGTPDGPTGAAGAVRDVIRVEYRDENRFAGTLAGVGSAVVTLGPPELREAVLSRLRAAARTHAGAGGPEPAAAPVAGGAPSTGQRPEGRTGRHGFTHRGRPSNTERAVRLLGIVAYLQEHGETPARALAEQFGLTREALAEDLALLWTTGWDESDAGSFFDFVFRDAAGAEIEDDDTTRVLREAATVTLTADQSVGRPLRLGVLEGAALASALRALGAQPAFVTPGAVSAAGKIEAALGDLAPLADGVDAVVSRDAAPGFAAVLRQAIVDHRPVRLDYVDAEDRPSQRAVEPERIRTDHVNWLLDAWDPDAGGGAGADRTFRLDRIVALSVLDSPVPGDREPGGSRRASAAGTETEVVSPATARVAFTPRGRGIGDGLDGVLGSEDRADGGRVLTVELTHPAWLRGLALGNAPDVEVLAPKQLRAAIARAAREAVAAYRGA